MSSGIDTIGFYVPAYYLDLETLALVRQVDIAKFHVGLGQEKMAVLPPDEDVVTMGANAAFEAMKSVDPEDIDTILFATESSIDQSKAAGIYVHKLLDLPKTCRVIELKQACYGGTGGLQLAVALSSLRPHKKVLLIASDIARYGLNHPAEPTQGGGAVAMVISSHPRLLALESNCGLYTDDVMDFWRPNYAREAFVEGKYSTFVYLRALEEVWRNYQAQSPLSFSDIDCHCYHTPISRLVEKAHQALLTLNGGAKLSAEDLHRALESTLHYSRRIGNTYTASLYIGLLSLLENAAEDLTGKRIGFYSYGSGCVAEYFTGIIQSTYHNRLYPKQHRLALDARKALSYAEYERFFCARLSEEGDEEVIPQYKTGLFRLSGIKNHQRIYEKVL